MLCPLHQLMCSYRYMTISDEWDIPEKQPFKDLVSYASAGNGNMQ